MRQTQRCLFLIVMCIVGDLGVVNRSKLGWTSYVQELEEPDDMHYF